MYRQSPSRNQRSKRMKVKHVLQICLLLGVCFWLIYQVKHSHDKKKELDESDAKPLLVRENSETFLKLGRKDVQTRMEETSTNKKHDGAAEEVAGEDVEENKHEEDEPEERIVEAKEDKMMDAGDDETDEHGREKLGEVEIWENLLDNKETAEGDENENEEKDIENGDEHTEKESFVEESDQDGDDTSTHEAREENYKGDDASSAVTHDIQIAGIIENENEHEENLSQRHEDNVEQEFDENNGGETDEGVQSKELEEETGEMYKDGKQPNVTNSEAEGNSVDNSMHNSSFIETVTQDFDDNAETRNSSSADVTIENYNASLSYLQGSDLDLDHNEEISTMDEPLQELKLRVIGVERTVNSTLNVDDSQLGSNSTNLEFSGASNNSDSLSEKDDAIETEKSASVVNTYEILESEKNEDPDKILQDSIDLSDSSNSLEEKDVRTDLDTLPEMQTEGFNNQDVASE